MKTGIGTHLSDPKTPIRPAPKAKSTGIFISKNNDQFNNRMNNLTLLLKSLRVCANSSLPMVLGKFNVDFIFDVVVVDLCLPEDQVI